MFGCLHKWLSQMALSSVLSALYISKHQWLSQTYLSLSAFDEYLDSPKWQSYFTTAPLC